MTHTTSFTLVFVHYHVQELGELHTNVQLIPHEDTMSYSAQLDVAFAKCQADTKALYTSEVCLYTIYYS
jgi:hypothetical protein